MRALPTFLIVVAIGAVLASTVQAASVPAWAAFMLGLAYLLVVSLVINTIAGAAR
ncbi:hypothetical protein [Sphingomonas sp. CROZ-RG-20F-R02-07]|uniref:hypothetical protein n=1 Tax=Sphingomonas sp. CROZ-RG-20F-R02-07 TaxID=2914832 RepID=UPI001F594414|nr:hypothetical protein [Sphingomonas sp. CROZ-RG-20F-R02-07]